MKNFNRGGSFGEKKGGGGFDRRDSGNRNFSRGNDSSARPTMHQAICADCGQSCEVPFKPSGNRPVYCSNCFGKSNQGRNNSGGRVNVNANHGISNEQFESLNAKLDAILNFLKPALAIEPLAKKEDKKEVNKSEEKKLSKKIVKKIIPAKKISKQISKKNK